MTHPLLYWTYGSFDHGNDLYYTSINAESCNKDSNYAEHVSASASFNLSNANCCRNIATWYIFLNENWRSTVWYLTVVLSAEPFRHNGNFSIKKCCILCSWYCGRVPAKPSGYSKWQMDHPLFCTKKTLQSYLSKLLYIIPKPELRWSFCLRPFKRDKHQSSLVTNPNFQRSTGRISFLSSQQNKGVSVNIELLGCPRKLVNG